MTVATAGHPPGVGRTVDVVAPLPPFGGWGAPIAPRRCLPSLGLWVAVVAARSRSVVFSLGHWRRFPVVAGLWLSVFRWLCLAFDLLAIRAPIRKVLSSMHILTVTNQRVNMQTNVRTKKQPKTIMSHLFSLSVAFMSLVEAYGSDNLYLISEPGRSGAHKSHYHTHLLEERKLEMTRKQRQSWEEAAAEFRSRYAAQQTDIVPTLKVRTQQITKAGLTTASRKRRNRSKLYQRKHDPTDAKEHGAHTHQRPAAMADLNRPIPWHYQRFLAANGWYESTAPPTYAFGIGDLTANPLRPSYNASEHEPLFFLKDEPIGDVRYTLLVCYLCEDEIRFAILHEVQVGKDGSLPLGVPSQIREGLAFWAACPAVLTNGNYCPTSFATLDYDIRHWTGWFARDEAEEAAMWKLHRCFPNHDEWKKAVQEALDRGLQPKPIYHAALGIADDERVVIVHRVATPQGLAEELALEGCRQGVLLDTGGSPFLWSNLPVSEGTVLACSSEFRPNRGAVVFLAMDGERYNTKRATCRAI